ncbi:YL1 nuclear protein C-terminal domain-containing protein [Phyllosticta capitalensis]|uniref:YL1 nuclear protein C-terminal domain-containing protein n=1 Tax=Phyllosticta capitalensis TaxID=121624 RepID=UPI00312ED0CE
MAPLQPNRTEVDHNALLEKLDLFRVRKPFRNPDWKPPQRRNKNIKQIISEAQRKEASLMATQNNSGSSTPATGNMPNGPAVTYTNVEAPPSLQVKRKYCDITGLPSKYTDPKTRLRYHNAEIFGIIRTMGQSVTENYLAARGAHTVLK